MSLLDDVFEVLQIATRLEATGMNRIEAATKYFEAIYLMKQYLQRTPHTTEEAPKRRLLQDKIGHYEKVAARLLQDDRSTTQTITSNPRSPMANQCFFNEDSSVVALPPPDSSPRLAQSLSMNVSLANQNLAKAIMLDEKGQTQAAIDTYMAASEIYLGAIKFAESSKQQGSAPAMIAPVLVKRLEGVLDRIQQLKQPRAKQGLLFQRDKSLQSVNMSTPDTIGKSTLTRDEVSVLKRSSMIASGLFLPWSEEDAKNLSLRVQKLTSSTQLSLFTDPDGELCLSKEQRKHFFKYARPTEIMQLRQRRGVVQHAPVLIKSITPYTIRQRCVTDCSFIASLCICAAFERRFRKRLVTSIIFPQDENGIPIANPEGKYMVKLWLNGIARQVTIDDRLPIDRHSNLLCSHTMGNTNQLELWVSLIEKAYMKLCGGYDFPGSNSGVDLFSLTGWIPERIFFAKDDVTTNLKDFETPPARAWERLVSANSFGDCLITVSTTREMSDEQAQVLGLVTGHAYAVLDVIQTRNGTRMLLLKNPWASNGWKGKFSRFDRRSWSDPAFQSEVGYNPDEVSNEDDGIFWISWDDVLHYFRNLQLSWNPALFPHRVTKHDFWPKAQGPTNDTFNIGENPQYVLTLSDEGLAKKATVWVLISRHVERQEQEGCEVTDFLTIHLLKNTEKKEVMWYPHGSMSLVVGAYTNNPHVLVRYDVTGSADKYISLVLSQYKKSHDMGYTLSCYCTHPFSIGKPAQDLPFQRELVNSWTAGCGPVGDDRFFQNPMWVVTLPENATCQLRCFTEKAFAVNVMLLAVQERSASFRNYRQLAMTSGKPILDSGNYRYGFAVTKSETVSAGRYLLIVSTYEPGQTGVFRIDVCSSVQVKVESVP